MDVSSQRLEISTDTCDRFSHLYIPLVECEHPENRTREVQLGPHTVRSHGFTLARKHMYDWLIVMLLLATKLILNVIHPFYRFVGKDMMADIMYPMKSNTVSIWAVRMCSVLLPIAIFLIFYFRRRDVYDLHHAILGLFFSILITGVITDAIKDAVGRPRPDFFWRCFPDGKDVYDQWGNVICHGDKGVIREGHKSFPSGHTSLSFAGLGFLSLYLSGKIKVFDRSGHVAKLCIVFLPLLFASLVGISRVDDYRHHWQDVFAGSLLGLTVSAFCYLQFFPPPYHAEGWGPYAYFQALTELRTNRSAPDAPLNGQATGVRVENLQDEGNSNVFPEISLSGNSSLTAEDIESGRR